MVDEETRRKLREMGMGEMVEAIDLQDADRTADAMPFGERVRMMVDCAYEAKSTVLCTQHVPAERHGRLGGGVQADAMVDRLVHGSIRID